MNDRLLTELLNNDADADIDRTTTYAYTGTQQTKKTVWQGTDTNPASGTKLSETANTYDARGRLAKVEINSNGAGPIETTVSYKYNAEGIRVGSTEQVGTGGVTTTVFHVDPYNHTGFAQVLEEAGSLKTFMALSHAQPEGHW